MSGLVRFYLRRDAAICRLLGGGADVARTPPICSD